MPNQGNLDNPVKRKLKAGELVLCMALRQARTVDAAFIAKAAGFDAFYVDQEHSPIPTDVTSMICGAGLALGLTPMVRVPSHSAHHISRALDGGALGIIAPHVDDPEQAAGIVAETKFPPLGRRSVSSLGLATRYCALPVAESIRQQNDATLVVAMLETRRAIENADAIAAVDGIDMLLVGAQDLSVDIGLPGDVAHPEVRRACLHTFDACTRHGRTFAVGGADRSLQAEMVEKGARFLSAGMDVSYLLNAARADVQRLRALAEPEIVTL